MEKIGIYHIHILIIITLLLNGCLFQSNPENHPIAGHVIIIGVDGLSPNGVQNAIAPTLHRMIDEGSYAFHARSVMPSSSGANWASMVNGAGPEQHGVFTNEWRSDNFTLPPVVVYNENLFPSIYAAIRHQKSDAETGGIFDWNPITNFIEQEATSYLELPSSEDETTRLAVAYIKEKKPDFLFVHLDHVDTALHGFGHGTENYYQAVAKADSLIEQILFAVEEAEMMGETVFIISSDHGGLGQGHGGNSLQEMEIPFIVYGKNVKHNYNIEVPVNIFDIPATALFAMGLDVPYEWVGRPVKSVFNGFAAPKLMFSLNNLIAEPDIIPGRDGFNPAGGLFIGDPALLDMRNPSNRGEIRFTLDGTIPNAASDIFSDPIYITENTVVNAGIFENGRLISDMNTGYFRLLDKPESHGLRYTIYEKDDMQLLPDFSTLEPVNRGITLEISSNDLDLPRRNNVAAVMEGYIEIEENAEYRFYLASDDGSKFYIDGHEVVDNDGEHGVIERSGSIYLEPGMHPLRIEWFNSGGGYWLGAFIEGPGLPKQIIPANMLYTER